jgi:hypothetical protein
VNEAFDPARLSAGKTTRYAELAVEIAAVLDVDATTRAAFDEVDATGLKTILGRIFAAATVPA